MRRAWVAVLLITALAAPALADESTEALVDKLGSENSTDSFAAYQELVANKDAAAIPLIVARVHDWTTYAQGNGVRVIEYVRDKKTEPALRKLLTSDAPYVTVCAATALWRLGHRDMGPVFTKAVAATRNDETQLTLVLNAMSTYDMPEARETARELLETLERAYPFSRVAYYFHIVGGDEAALPIVTQRLGDDDAGVRGVAAAYLYRFGERERATVLAEAIKAGIEYSPFITINNLLNASGAIATPILEAVAERLDEETSSGYVNTMMRLLHNGGYPGIATILRARVDDDNDVIAQTALELLMSTSGVDRETLVDLLESDDDKRRLLAAEALRRTDDLSGLPVVLEIVRDNPARRSDAIRVLGGFRVRAAVEPLLDALADPNSSVRSNAYSSLSTVLTSLFPYRRFDISSTGYTYGASEADRALGIERLRAWWAANKDKGW